jgi:hypothetical protein
MKLIKTNDYLLLIDEKAEIVGGGYFYRKAGTDSMVEGVDRAGPGELIYGYPEIVGYYPLTKEAKELDLPLLPKFDKGVDIEKLAIEKYPRQIKSIQGAREEGFIAGYKAAQSDKQFSLEDVKRISYCLRTGFDLNGDRIISNEVEDLIVELSLSTQQLPKEFIISDKFSTFEENIKNGEYRW